MKTLALFLAIAFTAFGSGPRKTIFLDKMGGFEKYIEDALKAMEVNVEVLEEEEHPDLKVLLGNRFKSVYAEVLYKKQTGRQDDTELQLVDVNTGKTLFVHQFRMGDEEAKKRAAVSFAEKLKKKLSETK
jgi:hypothetical protein